jgi:hypothetical protein
VLDIIGLLTDRDRERVVADLTALAEEGNRIDDARAALSAQEQIILGRERECERRAADLDRREREAGERDQAQQHREQRLNEMQARIDAFRADVKQKMAA